MLLVTLTFIIWMTTALRQLSLMTSQGQSLLVFLNITLLTLPNLVAIIAPMALLIATLHTMNRLSGDSELIVLSASGATIWRVLKPYLVLASLVSVTVFAVNAYFAPLAQRTLREYAVKVRTDLISHVLQPNIFSSPEPGLTFYIAERDMSNGNLLGLLINDERDEDSRESNDRAPSERPQSMTYLAQWAEIVKQEDRTLLTMYNGHIHSRDNKSRDVAVLQFDRYIFDLSQFGPKEGKTDYRPRERFLTELLWPNKTDPNYKAQEGKYRAELNDRLANPLYAFMFVLIVGVYLGYPRTTRDNRGQSVFAAFTVAAFLRVVGLAGANMLAKKTGAIFVVWGVPVAGIIVTLWMVHYQIKPLSFSSLSLPLRSRNKAQALPQSRNKTRPGIVMPPDSSTKNT